MHADQTVTTSPSGITQRRTLLSDGRELVYFDDAGRRRRP